MPPAIASRHVTATFQVEPGSQKLVTPLLSTFAAFHTAVQAFFGAPGTLSPAERDYVTGSRAWRDRVDGLAGVTACVRSNSNHGNPRSGVCPSAAPATPITKAAPNVRDRTHLIIAVGLAV